MDRFQIKNVLNQRLTRFVVDLDVTLDLTKEIMSRS